MLASNRPQSPYTLNHEGCAKIRAYAEIASADILSKAASIMAVLPKVDTDPTLDAVDRALVEAETRRERRTYLGMSGIGHPCERKCWYDFRWVSTVQHNAETLKRFADGHHGEDVQAARLRLVPGITLVTVDETGRQYRFEDCDGHFAGHIDGAIVGLLQAPKTWCVWEHKQVGEKKQAKLSALKASLGEKRALAAWDETYHAQALLYMYYSGMTRHYLTCSTPGGRSTISVRTDEDKATARKLREKAARVVAAQTPPARLRDDPDFYLCRWCDHAEVCHRSQPAVRTCRSCQHGMPHEAGAWRCNLSGRSLDRAQQERACESYVPLESLSGAQP